MADIITTQLVWNGDNECYAFWKVAPCCGAPDPMGAIKCCLTWWFCGCFAGCQMWGTQFGGKSCAVVNHCLIPCLIPCALVGIGFLVPKVMYVFYTIADILFGTFLRYNIRQKHGIQAAGPCNGMLGDCLCATFGNMFCGLAFCQQCRAVQVEEWDCFGVWIQGGTPPIPIQQPLGLDTVCCVGGPPGGGGGGGGAVQPGYSAMKR